VPSRPALPFAALVAAALLGAPLPALAGAQAEEELAHSVASLLSRAIADRPVPPDWEQRAAAHAWIDAMSKRLAARMPDEAERRELLRSVHYESVRAGLDPQLVLGVIHHESGFKKYAVSVANARGYMQVMPFWTRVIGGPEHNLFHLRTNLRYGAVILRHYLDRENGDLFRALGRYNGSLGRAEYPNAVLAAMQRYAYDVTPVSIGVAVTPVVLPARQ
jgi:soluble lytic murein transglycosylase-like protein